MIYQEALKAMKSREKIKACGLTYKWINAIIFRAEVADEAEG